MRFKPLDHSISRDELADAIIAKNKRKLKRERPGVINLVNGISPIYRELVYRIISDNSITFRTDSGGVTLYESKGSDRHWGRKVEKTLDAFLSPSTFCHELGHCADNFYGGTQTLSRVIEIEGGRALSEIFEDELLENKDKIYTYVLKAYWDLVEKKFGKEKKDILYHYMPLYELLHRYQTDGVSKATWLSARRVLHKILDRVGFTPLYCDLAESKIAKEINDMMDPIGDALSSLFVFPSIGLAGHTSTYYSDDEERPSSEFFANLFEVEVTSNQLKESFLKKLLPKSFEAFQKLFGIVQNHFISGEPLPSPLTRDKKLDDEARERWQKAADASALYASTFAVDDWQMPEDIQIEVAKIEGIFKGADKLHYIKESKSFDFLSEA